MTQLAFLLTQLPNKIGSSLICAAADRDPCQADLCVGRKTELNQRKDCELCAQKEPGSSRWIGIQYFLLLSSCFECQS